jgi:hypothetical protein
MAAFGGGLVANTLVHRPEGAPVSDGFRLGSGGGGGALGLTVGGVGSVMMSFSSVRNGVRLARVDETHTTIPGIVSASALLGAAWWGASLTMPEKTWSAGDAWLGAGLGVAFFGGGLTQHILNAQTARSTGAITRRPTATGVRLVPSARGLRLVGQF